MKHFILMATMLLTFSFANAQTWKFSTDSDNFTMTRTGDGVYRLIGNYSDGNTIVSEIRRYQVRYDDIYAYQVYNINGTQVTTGTTQYEEYCTERILSGDGTPWDKVVIRWLDSPICLDSCRDIEIVILDSNDEVSRAFLPRKL
jgi:hypothetical protein